jgi:hypothetical protein
MAATSMDHASRSAIIGPQLAFAKNVRNICILASIIAVVFCVLTGQSRRLTISAPALVFAFGMAILLGWGAIAAVRYGVVILTLTAISRSSRPLLYWVCVAVMIAMAATIPVLVVLLIGIEQQRVV